jgi:uncharacterized protein YcbX
MAATLSAIHIYPVKGLGAIALGQAEVTPRGLRHDRRFMVVDPRGEFLTQRDIPRMATVWTDLDGGNLRLAAPDAGEVALSAEPLEGEAMTVRVWSSTCRAIAPSPEADRWLTAYLGSACRLAYMPEDSRRPVNAKYGGEHIVSFADGYALLVTGEASLADLNRRLAARGHRALPMSRFRPNLVLSGAEPYAEDSLGEFRIGSARLRGAKPCGRCQVTTTDQSTGEIAGPEPLATLATYRDSAEFGVMFGMNCVSLAPGALRVGDAVEPPA